MERIIKPRLINSADNELLHLIRLIKYDIAYYYSLAVNTFGVNKKCC